MKKRNLFMALLASTIMATAAEPTVVDITPTGGTFSHSGGWAQSWVSHYSPTVTLTAGRRDMMAASDGTGLMLMEGTAFSSTYTISVSGAWRVSGYSFDFKGNSGDNPTTISAGRRTMQSVVDATQTFAVENIAEDAIAQFTLTGENQGVYATNFHVELTPIEPEAYDVIALDMTRGGIGTSTSGWSKLWSLTPDERGRQIFLSCINPSGNAISLLGAADNGTDIAVKETTATSLSLLISSAGAWRVSGYDVTYVAENSPEPKSVSATGLQTGEKAMIQLGAGNGKITFTDFKVQVTEMNADKSGVHVFAYTGYHPYSTCYRIPTLAYIGAGEHKGRILAVNDFRPCGMDIGYGEVDLHTSISDDGGYNWSYPADPVDAEGKHVADGDGKGTVATSNSNRDCGFGDPSIVADRETGELLMLAVCGRVPIGQTTREIPQGLAVWNSTDGGATWTPWRDITEHILTQLDDNCRYGRIEGLFFTAGRLIQSQYIKVGSHYRVYAVGGGVVQVNASSRDTQCWVFYSDDFGATWQILGDPYNPALPTGGAEPKCEELPDGSLLYSGRAVGGRNFNIFTYTDYQSGAGFWDENPCFGKMFTGAPGCDGDAMVIPVSSNDDGASAYLLMQSIPLNASARVNVGINYKVLGQGYDDFGTVEAVASNWDGAYQVSKIGSAYSSLALFDDGTLGFIFEESTYGCDYTEVFRRLTVEQITDGEYSYVPDTQKETALRLAGELIAGKTAAAEQAYGDRPELLQGLKDAADAFAAEPSRDGYLEFNRALWSVKNNQKWEQTSIDEIAAPTADATILFDLTGRRVAPGAHGGIYVTSDGHKIIK